MLLLVGQKDGATKTIQTLKSVGRDPRVLKNAELIQKHPSHLEGWIPESQEVSLTPVH